MQTFRSVVLGAVMLTLTPVLSNAQDRRVHVNFGGGPTFAGGDIGDKFGTGWGPAIGVTVNVTERLGIQFEYAYRWFDVTDSIDALGGLLDANHQTHQLDFNLVANLTAPDSAVRVYALGGPGMYNRKVEITKYEGTGIICDPWYYICGAYPVSSVLGSRGGWDFGVNFGGGVGFRIGDESEFYIESRMHYVIGPDINPEVQPIGTTLNGGSTNGYYFPLTFGFRF